MDTNLTQNDLYEHGYSLCSGVLTPAECVALAEAIAFVGGEVPASGASANVRNLMDRVPAVRRMAASPAMRCLVDPILGSGAFPVRAILFDKTPDCNWKVPWHQDLSIAVKRRVDVDGYGPWSVKEGVPHVQPPPAILERMLTVRLHLDPSGPENGQVRVIPGSHRVGKLAVSSIAAAAADGREATFSASVGDVLLMRPLLLHASSPSRAPSRRRVVHIEYAACELPGGLDWYER